MNFGAIRSPEADPTFNALLYPRTLGVAASRVVSTRRRSGALRFVTTGVHMIKNVLAKVAASALVGASFVAVPALAGLAPATAAPKPGCTYATPATTTTSLNTNTTMVQAGGTVSGTATVSAPGPLPAGGTLTITAYPYINGTYATTGTVLASETPTDGTLTFSRNDLPADRTYRLVATYTSGECTYQDSQSAPKYVSVYPYSTNVAVTGSGTTQHIATVTAPNRSSDSTVPAPTGTVRFISRNNGGNLVTQDVPLQPNGTASFTLPNNHTFVSAQYLGDGTYYSASNVDTTRNANP